MGISYFSIGNIKLQYFLQYIAQKQGWSFHKGLFVVSTGCILYDRIAILSVTTLRMTL